MSSTMKTSSPSPCEKSITNKRKKEEDIRETAATMKTCTRQEKYLALSSLISIYPPRLSIHDKHRWPRERKRKNRALLFSRMHWGVTTSDALMYERRGGRATTKWDQTSPKERWPYVCYSYITLSWLYPRCTKQKGNDIKKEKIDEM